ncbi:MAG: anti-sigma factor [Acidimicrobiales bacterium]|nr:anti-sigma factor [Acidimicrobiales bacterium]
MNPIQNDDCSAVGDLLGAYALDAVDADEAPFVAAHLAGCPRCRQEHDRHRETAGLLAAAGGPAPEGVWGRIAAVIEGDVRAEAAPSLPQLAGRVSRSGPKRWQVAARAAVATVAAAAAVMVGVQTLRVDHLDHQVRQLNAAARQPDGSQGLAEALVDPTAKHLVLASTALGAEPLGQLVILLSGRAYLVGSRLPAAPVGKIYQLWSIIDGQAISVGLLGPRPSTIAFTIDPGASVSAYLVTVEPAGGVVAPTSSPVARAAR